MKGKLALLVGAGIGYVLGTRDGRQRYEQLKSQAKRTMNDPKVQEKASEVQHRVTGAASKVGQVAAEKMHRNGDTDAQQAPEETPGSTQGSTQGSTSSTGYPPS